MPRRRSSMDIAKVDLDERDADAKKRVTQRDRVVREGGRVEDDSVNRVGAVECVVGVGASAMAGGSVDAVDQRALVVGLEVRDLQSQSLGVGVDE